MTRYDEKDRRYVEVKADAAMGSRVPIRGIAARDGRRIASAAISKRSAVYGDGCVAARGLDEVC